MLALTAISAAAVLATAQAHNVIRGVDAMGSAVGADPAWVKHFSTGAGGLPEQLWINYGRTSDIMVVGWLTADMTAASTVSYGTTSGNLPLTATGNASFYKYSSAYTSGLIHHTWLTGLKLNTTYYYTVGGAGAQSAEHSFTTSPGVGAIYPYTFAFVADVGESNDANNTITHLYERKDFYDSIVINGDISYATGCESKGCTTWDAFQRMTQPVSAIKPWAVNLGNHELGDTANGIPAISSRYRYSGMPYPVGSKDDIFYFSYEVGPAHVISISSFYPRGFGATSPLTQWLQKDLAGLNRAVTPWVLVSLHAPWYNSNTAHHLDGETMRLAIEPILLAAGVNAIFAGHVHAYERSTPVANNQVMPAGEGIVHFNIGDGGAGLYTSWYATPAWSAYHEATWGHGELVIQSPTTAVWTWHRNQDSEPTTKDSYTITNKHVGAAAAGPEQIHIAYTGKAGDLSVDFVSTSAADGQVQFGVGSFSKTITTTSFMFNTVGNMHQGAMSYPGVKKGQAAWYRVSAGGVWSTNFTVYPIPNRAPHDVFAVFGDFGLVNDVVMNELVKEASEGAFDAVLHVGDWAYDFEDSNSAVGNNFMNLVQGYAALKPTMPAVGNHEACTSCASVPELPYSARNFTQYRARMHSVQLNAGAVSGSNSDVYYSFNQGLTHFIVFSAEAYAYNSGSAFLANQLAFMTADLAAVDRSVTPWVVALVHKDWTMEESAYAAFYPILDAGRVDLLFCGHVHYYNRYLPYNAVTKETDTACASAGNSVYTNPKYMVNIVVGSSGDKEGETPCVVGVLPPSVHCDPDFGFGYFQALNSTVATWKFKTVKQDYFGPANFTDSLTIINYNH